MKNADISFKNVLTAFTPVLIFIIVREAVKLLAHNLVLTAADNGGVLFGFSLTDLTTFNDVTAFLQSNSVYVTLICNLICILIFILMFRTDRAGAKEEAPNPVMTLLSLAASLCIAVAVTNIIHFTQLDGASGGYRTVMETYNSKDLWVQIIALGIAAPISEELCFRGLMYSRLKSIAGKGPAMTVSALCFGVVHGNIPQFGYAVVLGLFLAYFYEINGNVLVPVLAHIGVNILAVFMNNYGVLGWMYTNNATLAGATLVYASVAMMLIKMIKRQKAQGQ